MSGDITSSDESERIRRKLEARCLSRLIEALSHLKEAQTAVTTNLSIYHSQQACEFFVKAYLSMQGIEEIKIHSPARRMYRELKGPKQEQFKGLLEDITELEELYIPSRYDEEKEGKLRIPALEFNQEDKKWSIKTAKSCQEFCFELIESEFDKKLPRQKENLLAELKSNYSDVISEYK